ncbi:MAG: translocation/assembly module TamB domain-containing protein [Sphingomonadaceae bacterium]
MATVADPPIEPDAGDGSTGWLRRLFVAILLVALALAAAVPLGLWWLAETPSGRSFVARQVSGTALSSGIRYEVGRIDGSLLSRFELVDVVVKDLDGVLATIPLARVDWEPISLVRRVVSLNRLEVPEVRMLRMWRINPRDPDEPLLPDIDIRIGRFDFPRVVLEEPVAGRRTLLEATGRADIRAGRLLLDLQAAADSGDRMLLRLDAEPDSDRFDLAADIRAPADGLVAPRLGVEAPLAIRASGAGSWEQWRGRLAAELGEGQTAVRLADLVLTAEGGRFTATGPIDPAPLLGETAGRLARPSLEVSLSAEQGPRRAWAFEGTARSNALSLEAAGTLDPRANRLSGVTMQARLLDPSALDPALSGSGMVLALTAEGPLADPAIRWTADADTLRWAGADGTVGADGLRVEGQVRLAGEGRPLAIPFSATARQLAGLPPEQAGLLDAPRLTGTAELAGGAVIVRDARLQTSALTANGSGRLAPDGGLTASVEADIARFETDALGPLRARATAELARPAGGATRIAGRFAIDTLAPVDALGGRATASGGFALAGDGAIRIDDLAVRSPELALAGGTARYEPGSGRFELNAAGRTTRYGAFSLTARGTATEPFAAIRMPAPGFGLGVTDLVAEVSPAAGGIDLLVNGQSPGGPVTGRATILYGGNQPLTVAIREAAVAGATIQGTLTRTAAGPLAGTLTLGGAGLDGRVVLAAERDLQRVEVDARALNARLPLDPPVRIAAGQARFSILLVPDRPHVRGSFNARGVRRDRLVLTSIEGTANLAGDQGVATITAAGRSGTSEPFSGTARVQSVADGYALLLDGRVGTLPLKLDRPARIVRAGSGWELLPARVVLPRGQLDVAGATGAQPQLRLVMRDVDLAAFDAVLPGSGLGGTVSGELSVRQVPGARIPEGEANLRVKGLERASITGRSVPVDLAIAGRSDGAALQAGARMTWQGNELGRLVLRVDPGPGDTPAARFLAGALSGGVRYNGPVEPLWALVGLEGQELRGAIAVGADFAGTSADPSLRGLARGKGLIYRNAQFGTEITDIGFDGVFGGAGLRLNSVTGRANGGTIAGSGTIRFDAAADPAVDLSLALDRARLANSDAIELTLSGPLTLRGARANSTLSGDLRVDSARIQLVQVETSEVPQLAVRRAGEVRLPDPEPRLSAATIALEVRVRADDRIRVEGMGLDSIWRADIRLRGTADAPQLIGTANLVRGDFTFAGSDFDITSGRVGFNGRLLDSSINIQAQTQASDVTAFVTISGTAARPDIRFSSQPSLPEDEILARLLFGTSVADLSVTEAVQLATAIAGLQSGIDTMGKIRRSVGLDRLRLVGDSNGMGTGLAIGKRLTRNLYVEVVTDSQGQTLTTIQLTLSRIWSLFVEVSSFGQNSANLRYQREY